MGQFVLESICDSTPGCRLRRTTRKHGEQLVNKLDSDVRATVDKLGDHDQCQAVAASPTPTIRASSSLSRCWRLANNDTRGLQSFPWEPDLSQDTPKVTVHALFLALYGQKKTDSLNTARYRSLIRVPKRPLVHQLFRLGCRGKWSCDTIGINSTGGITW